MCQKKSSELLDFCAPGKVAGGHECEGLRPERGANGAGFLVPTNDFSLLTRTALPIPDATGDVRRWVPRHSDRFRMYIPPNCEASNLLELMVLPPMRCACFPACSEVVVSHNSRLVRSRVLLMWWNIFSAKPLWRQRVRFLVSTAPAGRAERREVSSGGGKNNRVVVIWGGTSARSDGHD